MRLGLGVPLQVSSHQRTNSAITPYVPQSMPRSRPFITSSSRQPHPQGTFITWGYGQPDESSRTVCLAEQVRSRKRYSSIHPCLEEPPSFLLVGQNDNGLVFSTDHPPKRYALRS